jgi:hypothetical protein
MGLKHPFLTWFWVNYPTNSNGGQMGQKSITGNIT